MRILCELGKRKAVYKGWEKVFGECGHEVTLWDKKEKTAFDIFDEIEPHLFIQSSPLLIKYLKENKHTRIIEEFDPIEAGDTFLNINKRQEFECDICYVGNHTINKEVYIIPLSEDYQLKLFGEAPWPSAYYLGKIDDEFINSIYSSSKVCLNVSLSGRTRGRVFNSLLAGSLCVSTKLNDEILPNEFITQSATLNSFHSAIERIVSESDFLRKDIINKKGFILEHHTYWNRCEGLLRKANFNTEANKLIKVRNDTIGI